MTRNPEICPYIPEAVVKATGISIDYLDRHRPTSDSVVRTVCVAKKLSWASNRQTTRPEDQAYCLLGLLDVNMPLLYGEGGEKAFVRLQQELIRQSDDESIFAWRQPDSRFERTAGCGILAALPRYFEHAGNIERIDPDFSSEDGYHIRAPYAVTNKGLQFESRAIELVSSDSGRSMYIISLNGWVVERTLERMRKGEEELHVR